MSAVSNAPLTPLRFLERSAEVYPGKVAIVHGDRRVTYREFAGEATRLARALQASGIEPGDRVAYLCPNIPELLIAHFAVPLAGAVLVAINTRLATEEVRYICDHSGAKLLVVDSELRSIVTPVQDELETVREIVTVTDPEGEPDAGDASDGPSYADLLERGSDAPLALDGRGRAGHDHDQLHVGDHRASPRASCTATGAPTSTASGSCCTPSTGPTPSTCGHSRCSIATGGARPGR